MQKVVSRDSVKESENCLETTIILIKDDQEENTELQTENCGLESLAKESNDLHVLKNSILCSNGNLRQKENSDFSNNCNVMKDGTKGAIEFIDLINNTEIERNITNETNDNHQDCVELECTNILLKDFYGLKRTEGVVKENHGVTSQNDSLFASSTVSSLKKRSSFSTLILNNMESSYKNDDSNSVLEPTLTSKTNEHLSSSESDLYATYDKNTDNSINIKNSESVQQPMPSYETFYSASRKFSLSCPEISVNVESVKSPSNLLKHRNSVSLPEIRDYVKDTNQYSEIQNQNVRRNSFYSINDREYKFQSDNIKHKRKSKSVTNLLKKTFSLKSLKSGGLPCMPNLFKRFQERKKGKRNDFAKNYKGSSFKKFETSESFATIFISEDPEEKYDERINDNIDPSDVYCSVLFPDTSESIKSNNSNDQKAKVPVMKRFSWIPKWKASTFKKKGRSMSLFGSEISLKPTTSKVVATVDDKLLSNSNIFIKNEDFCKVPNADIKNTKRFSFNSFLTRNKESRTQNKKSTLINSISSTIVEGLNFNIKNKGIIKDATLSKEKIAHEYKVDESSFCSHEGKKSCRTQSEPCFQPLKTSNCILKENELEIQQFLNKYSLDLQREFYLENNLPTSTSRTYPCFYREYLFRNLQDIKNIGLQEILGTKNNLPYILKQAKDRNDFLAHLLQTEGQKSTTEKHNELNYDDDMLKNYSQSEDVDSSVRLPKYDVFLFPYKSSELESSVKQEKCNKTSSKLKNDEAVCQQCKIYDFPFKECNNKKQNNQLEKSSIKARDEFSKSNDSLENISNCRRHSNLRVRFSDAVVLNADEKIRLIKIFNDQDLEELDETDKASKDEDNANLVDQFSDNIPAIENNLNEVYKNSYLNMKTNQDGLIKELGISDNGKNIPTKKEKHRFPSTSDHDTKGNKNTNSFNNYVSEASDLIEKDKETIHTDMLNQENLEKEYNVDLSKKSRNDSFESNEGKFASVKVLNQLLANYNDKLSNTESETYQKDNSGMPFKNIKVTLDLSEKSVDLISPEINLNFKMCSELEKNIKKQNNSDQDISFCFKDINVSSFSFQPLSLSKQSANVVFNSEKLEMFSSVMETRSRIYQYLQLHKYRNHENKNLNYKGNLVGNTKNGMNLRPTLQHMQLEKPCLPVRDKQTNDKLVSISCFDLEADSKPIMIGNSKPNVEIINKSHITEVKKSENPQISVSVAPESPKIDSQKVIVKKVVRSPLTNRKFIISSVPQNGSFPNLRNITKCKNDSSLESFPHSTSSPSLCSSLSLTKQQNLELNEGLSLLPPVPLDPYFASNILIKNDGIKEKTRNESMKAKIHEIPVELSKEETNRTKQNSELLVSEYQSVLTSVLSDPLFTSDILNKNDELTQKTRIESMEAEIHEIPVQLFKTEFNRTKKKSELLVTESQSVLPSASLDPSITSVILKINDEIKKETVSDSMKTEIHETPNQLSKEVSSWATSESLPNDPFSLLCSISLDPFSLPLPLPLITSDILNKDEIKTTTINQSLKTEIHEIPDHASKKYNSANTTPNDHALMCECQTKLFSPCCIKSRNLSNNSHEKDTSFQNKIVCKTNSISSISCECSSPIRDDSKKMEYPKIQDPQIQSLKPIANPYIKFRTWLQRQQQNKNDLNHEQLSSIRQTDNVATSTLPEGVHLEVAQSTSSSSTNSTGSSSGSSRSSNKETPDDDRTQKDRDIDFYPETIRQRQKNMPSPNKVDIKVWHASSRPTSDKKFLPSVKALRSQFEAEDKSAVKKSAQNASNGINKIKKNGFDTTKITKKSSNGHFSSHSEASSLALSDTVSAISSSASEDSFVTDSSSDIGNSVLAKEEEIINSFRDNVRVSVSEKEVERVTASVVELTSLPHSEDTIELIYKQFPDSNLQPDMSILPSTQGWDPALLLQHLYKVPDCLPDPDGQSGPELNSVVNIEGYLDKLPSGRRKTTFWNAWKRRYFVAKNGVLYYYQNDQSEKPSLRMPLAGGRIELMDSPVEDLQTKHGQPLIAPMTACMLGIDDGKGRFVVVRCRSRAEALRWASALRSHTTAPPSGLYLQPWPRPQCPALLRDVVVVDIGACSTRAAVLASQPTLPQLFFPSVVATHRQTSAQVWGFEALSPAVRAESTLSFPIRPSHKISKLSVDLAAVTGLLEKTFSDLRIDPRDYSVQISLPRVLTKATQVELLRLLFERFGVKGANLTHQSILVLYAYNASSGVVVDIGERLDVVPITDGYIIEGGVSRVPYGGYRIAEHLRQFLFQNNICLTNEVDSYVIRETLESICYCAQHYNTEKQRCTLDTSAFAKAAPLRHFFPEGNQYDRFSEIILDFGRFQATEGLFNPDAWGLDHPGLHKLVHKAIQECSMDIRKELCGSIFLSGGVSLMPGLATRLAKEVDNLTPSTVKPQVHASEHRYHAAFLGACALAGSDAFSRSCVARDEWVAKGAAAADKWA